ncbi:MAG: PepSY-like domain-containing protein [Duncaniella sp.]|nr:PepSY-like domain-containing protein [Duncaniella sp.]
MKKLLKLLPLLVAIFGAVALWSCSDDDDKTIKSDELPAAAQQFLATYYPGVKIASATKDGSSYDVTLANGHSVDFNLQGEWTDVEAPLGETIPSGFYPFAIDSYISSLPLTTGINEISKTFGGGYEVETVAGLELLFNAQGDYLGIDN